MESSCNPSSVNLAREVRVRFAPSPTGFLHLGGARTALFNWLFARSQKGQFFLRIEDTDRSRSTEEAIEAIIDGLTWLGLTWDRWEGSDPPAVRQTDRFEIYRKKVFELLDSGRAYSCYCTAEELEARRKEALASGKTPRYDGRCRNRAHPVSGGTAAIRFAAETEGEIVINDHVKGKVTFDAGVMDDMIILRSDGSPTYNFCVVVDDVAMQISHVIRGDDHLNNTPRQIGLYRAFGYPLPEFAHLSMILGHDKTRLSKRHGATAVQQYREEGYLPEAMINYLVRLGWSHKDQEIFTLSELVEKFSLHSVGASAAVFNPDKLRWLNAHYIKTGEPVKLGSLLAPHLAKRGMAMPSQELLDRIVTLTQGRSDTLSAMADAAAAFLGDAIVPDDQALQFLTKETRPILVAVRDRLSKVSFCHDTLKEAFQSLSLEMGLKLAQIAQPIRAAVTGKTVSPGIFDVLEVLGAGKTLARLTHQIARLE